jgi:anti-anti-sigma factor
MALRFDMHARGGCLILKAAGDFAERDCSTFLSVLRQGLRPGITEVVLDLGALSRVSSAALTELAAEHRRLAEAGCRLVLACANRRVRRMLAFSLVDQAIPTVDSLGQALGGPGSAGSPDGGRILGPDGLVG